MYPLVAEEPARIKELLAYWVPRNLDRLELPAPVPESVRQERAAAREVAIEETKQEIVRLSLLNAPIVVGNSKKPLRLCTKEELASHGGWIVKVADKLKSGQTPETAKMTEAQLWKLRTL